MNSHGIDRPRAKEVILDGVKYFISLKSTPGGMFRADWKCSVCQEDGAWAPISADPTEATRLAQAGLEVHHSFLHYRKMPRKG